MASIVELPVDPALEASQASSNQQLWQDPTKRFAAYGNPEVRLVAIQNLADGQVQPFQFRLILLI